ncbi:hypothetical protein E4U42_003737 [Claviceps africana]|uniref:LPXTG-domain-containing protein n=1 Tax=Claviceps africana TaxID=83212 RepID=A0A8K0NLC3_9HYPO|nr:hypothetical protein E4U42_003737 [Claviceps africana]
MGLIRRFLVAFPFCLSWAASGTALQVTPGSHCAIHCLDLPGGNEFKASESNTYTSDVSCRDVDYSNTDAGIKFRTCMQCLQASSKVDKTESDLKWYIYNLRFTLTTCLFGEPKPLPNGTVASQCNIDKACKSLQAPLTADQLQANPNTSWDYCTAHDGAFMDLSLPSCIYCLQATEGEVYLSNFLTALETGCRQAPVDGDVLALSGSVFSTTAVNMTMSKDSDSTPSSGTLSPSAIAAIVIGVILLFVVALALLFIHFRRESSLDAWERVRLEDSSRRTRSYLYPGVSGVMANPYQRYYGTAFPGQRSVAAVGTAGEYYDEMEKKFKITKYNPYEAKKSPSHASSATTKVDDDSFSLPRDGDQKQQQEQQQNQDQDQDVITRSEVPSTPPRIPHLPHPQDRFSTTDSFILQQYLDAAEESAKLAAQKPRPPEPVAEPPSRPKGGIANRFPHLTLPSLSKLRAKRPRNLHISLPIATSAAAQREYEMHMSAPASRDQIRSQDRSLFSRIMYGNPRARSSGSRPQEIIYDGYIEVPLRSGKGDLYGF